MGYQEARELAFLRQTLRELLTAAQPTGANACLARFRELCQGDLELQGEYQRWAFRFEILAAAA